MEKLGEGVSDSVVVWEERGEKKEKSHEGREVRNTCRDDRRDYYPIVWF